jgi:hypothetical protein
MPDRIMGMKDQFVGLAPVEMKDARLVMIDPNDSMIVRAHAAYSSARSPAGLSQPFQKVWALDDSLTMHVRLPASSPAIAACRKLKVPFFQAKDAAEPRQKSGLPAFGTAGSCSVLYLFTFSAQTFSAHSPRGRP